MFSSILIANRGEIACRIIRSARAMGIKTIAVHSTADAGALHVDMASDAVEIGPPAAAESYLNMDAILAAVEETGAEAVHPGYGFLSERAEFAERLSDAGVAFIGPRPDAIRRMGDKIESKNIAIAAGVPTVPGTAEPVSDAGAAKKIAGEIGYPIMLKASAGGGGKGMRLVRSAESFEDDLRACQAEALASFGDDRVFIEKFIIDPRHIEIQVLADSHGNIVHLGERECSIQRRHQKVIEEAPSPFVDAELRAKMGAQAIQLATAVDYVSAGTVEFIVDKDRNFFFLEMNTRLQVEHPVTEGVTGLDLVEQMIRVADGQELGFTQDDVKIEGWSMESRVYAEDPERGFLPSIGRLTRYREPTTGVFGTSKNVRVDGGAHEGDEINRYYDPMVAKLITKGATRDEAIAHMRGALDEYYVRGVVHNLEFLAAVMRNPRFVEGAITTNFIAEEFGDRYLPEEAEPENMEHLVAVSGAIQEILKRRQARLSAGAPPKPAALDIAGGAGEPAGGTEPGSDPVSEWVVVAGSAHFPVAVGRPNGGWIAVVNGTRHQIDTDWRPGDGLFKGAIDGAPICIQVDRTPKGFTLRQGGCRATVQVLSPKAAEMLARMPPRAAADTSKQLVSPMPGQIVSIAVVAGMEVKRGDPLVIMEAMKMENQLVAERDGVVSAVHLAPGDNVDVGEIILEFE